MYHSFPSPDPEAAAKTTPPPPPPALWRRLSRRSQLGILGISAAAAGLVGVNSFGGREAQAGPPPPPSVTVSRPLQRSIVEWDDYTGRFEASQSVEIRPRVSGQLIAVHFREGDVVTKGQLLFTVDPRPFLASLNEARARAASAVTAAALARSEYARAARLIDHEAVSQEEVDSLRAAMRAAEAGVAAAQAVVRQRALDLEFTQVRAPITGRVSDRRVDIGNIVAGNETMLTTLLALDPIHFTFEGSEALYLKSLRERARGTGTAGRDPAPGRGRLWLEGQGRLHRQCARPALGHDARPRPDRQSRLLPRARHVRQHAADLGRRARPLCLSRTRRCGPIRRAGSCSSSARTAWSRRARSSPGRWSAACAASARASAPIDRVVISGVQFAEPGAKVNARPGRIERPASAPAQRPARSPGFAGDAGAR